MGSSAGPGEFLTQPRLSVIPVSYPANKLRCRLLDTPAYDTTKSRTKNVAGLCACAFLLCAASSSAVAGNEDDRPLTRRRPRHLSSTSSSSWVRTRSFDHLFATYVPQSRSEKVRNLLSGGIVNADGTPGPKFAKAHQYKIVSAPNG